MYTSELYRSMENKENIKNWLRESYSDFDFNSENHCNRNNNG